ncbi:hypothetical protein [Ralstonia sp. GP101]|uniref:hypothetical protein n=1 Tax=Ralstonia sp. GP101 TaxID=3035146 RepID=UPI0038916E1C
MRKIVPKAKEKTPGVKAVLIFHDSFLRAKRRMKECTSIRPVIDLPEIISAMIDVCDADPAVMEKVGKKMLERRAQQAGRIAKRSQVRSQQREAIQLGRRSIGTFSGLRSAAPDVASGTLATSIRASAGLYWDIFRVAGGNRKMQQVLANLLAALLGQAIGTFSGLAAIGSCR